MNDYDARMLGSDAQESLRSRVARSVVDQGMSQARAVRTFKVSRTSVHEWTKAYRARGEAVLIAFCERLLRSTDRKILDRHPTHRSKRFHAWLADRADRIELFYLPAYSPELNPDECLNQDVKSNAVGRKRAATQGGMVSNVRSHLQSIQRRPDMVKGFFQEPHVMYAA